MQKYSKRNPLYSYEHVALPQWIFNDPERIAKLFNHDFRGTYYDGLKWVFEQDGEKLPYQKEDLNGFVQLLDDGTHVVALQGLDTSEDTLCYNMYFFFDVNSGKTAYYCSEVGHHMFDNSQSVVLCERNVNNTHINHGFMQPMDTIGQLCFEVRYFYCKFKEASAEIPRMVPFNEAKEKRDPNFKFVGCEKCGGGTIYDLTGMQNKEVCIICSNCMDTKIYEN